MFWTSLFVGHGVDSATGLPIYSLYGEVRAPTAEMLDGLDVLIVDLQDIGSRTYTYVSTMIVSMRAAGENDLPVIVLDRPNPIGGVLAQGPILEAAHASFVGMLPVPLRHGMTFGEMALMANAVLEIRANLVIVPTAGWARSQWFDDTGLPWVPPSPNMPSLESAAHYPGMVLFEATNLSVGRGTPIAFQTIGAPWLPAREIIDRLPPMAGVSISDTTITPLDPTDGKHAGATIPAIRFLLLTVRVTTPRNWQLRFCGSFGRWLGIPLEIREDAMARLAGTDQVRTVADDADIQSEWESGLTDFARRVQPYLIYK